MGLWTGIKAKSYIEPIRLNYEITSIKLNVKKDFIDYDCLNGECINAINAVASAMQEYAEQSRKQYELFVLSELYNRGYDLLRLESSNCWRKIISISANCEREQFYVDGNLVLTVNKKTRFESSENKHMIYTDFEVE